MVKTQTNGLNTKASARILDKYKILKSLLLVMEKFVYYLSFVLAIATLVCFFFEQTYYYLVLSHFIGVSLHVFYQIGLRWYRHQVFSDSINQIVSTNKKANAQTKKKYAGQLPRRS